MKWPDVTVLVVTYDRYATIQKTIAALQKRLEYPREHLHLLVADDATPGDYVERLSNLKAFQPGKEWASVRFSVTPQNVGWGANVNYALSQVQTEFVYFTEDDYELKTALDLRVGVALLDSKHHIGMLRYRGTAGTHLVLHHFEADIKAYLPSFLEGEGSMVPGKLTYLQIDGGSPNVWLYSNGPHLKTMRFHECYGLYAEGLKLGATEESYAHTVKDIMQASPDSALGIAILPEWIPMRYAHIGESYQLSEKDKGK